MAVFPENMDRLNVEDVAKSLSIIENYIRYMCERTEFSMRNMTKTVSEAGVSSAEIYVLVTAMNNTLSALQSTVNGMSGNITSLANSQVAMQQQLGKLQKDLEGVQSSLVRMQQQLTELDLRTSSVESANTAIGNQISSLEARVAALETT